MDKAAVMEENKMWQEIQREHVERRMERGIQGKRLPRLEPHSQTLLEYEEGAEGQGAGEG